MRGLTLAALILAMGLTLCGCQETGEVENQAYVLVMALDRAEGDALTLTARIPRIGKSGSKGDAGDSQGSPYLTFCVSAPSWSQALDALQWATPRRINLSHIEMIVASRELASQPGFPDLLNAVADTPHLYTNASFVVCGGSARAFLEAGNTVIGTRLSSEIHAMLSQYAHQGFISRTSLADVCFEANGIYGDPVAMWGETAGEGAASTVADSPMRQRFSGSALFRRGRFVRTLSSRDTRLLNLLRGHGGPLTYDWNGRALELSVKSPMQKQVLIDGNDVVLVLSLKLCAPEGLSDADAALVEAAIREDVSRLIASCQGLECDPFGFAEAAAGHFSTVPQWLSFDWHRHYSRAALDIDIDISISRPNP